MVFSVTSALFCESSAATGGPKRKFRLEKFSDKESCNISDWLEEAEFTFEFFNHTRLVGARCNLKIHQACPGVEPEILPREISPRLEIILRKDVIQFVSKSADIAIAQELDLLNHCQGW